MDGEYISREILLVANEDERSRLLKSQMEEMGFFLTISVDPNIILDLLENKFFVVALFELDTPKTDFGLSLIKKTMELSPLTHTYLLATRESFRAAVLSFRLGCKDTILYDEGNLPYLLNKIKKSASEITFEKDRDLLMQEMAATHKEFFKKMLALHIRLMDVTDELHYKEGIPDGELSPVSILIVDGDDEFHSKLEEILPQKNGWNTTHCSWGSEAFDIGANGNFSVALVNKSLPDLPGSMVASTLKATAPNTIILVFDYQKGIAQSIKLFEGSTSTEIPLSAGNINEVASKLRDIRKDLNLKTKKEQHIKTFKAQNFEFLQKYNRLKHKYSKLTDSEK